MKKILFIAFALLAVFQTRVTAQTISANDVQHQIVGNNVFGYNVTLSVKGAQNCSALGFRIDAPFDVCSENKLNGFTTLGTHKIQENDKKFLVYSQDNKALSSVFSIITTMRPTINASGEYLCRITDIEYATNDFKLISMPDVYFKVNVNNTNGIEGVPADQDDEQIYSVSGIKQSRLQNGVNIIRKADGKTVKVFK